MGRLPTGGSGDRPTLWLAQATERKDNGLAVRNIAPKDAAELDAVETREWLDSLDYVLQTAARRKSPGCSAS